MPKTTVRRKKVNLGLLVLHVPIGWEVKPLTPAERKARRKEKNAQKEKRRKERLDRWKVASTSRPEPDQKPKPAEPSVWHQPAKRPAGKRPGSRPSAGTCGAPTKDGTPCQNGSGCPIPAHQRGRRP